MPPRAPAAGSRPAKLSESRAVVPVGPREVVRSRRNQLATKRDEWGNKPSTIKAVTIRNGKHGTMGTGELVSTKIRMSGREKLDILAEDLESRYAQAVIVPYTSAKAIAIADSQFTNYLDDIQNLQDADLFKDIVEAEVLANKPHFVGGGGKKTKQPPNPLQNPDFIAKTLSFRIHNSYMLASAWRIVGQMLTDIQDVDDGEVRLHLKQNAEFRNKYLVLYRLATTIVEITQLRFSVLAKHAPHWNQFFKENPNKVPGQDQPEYVFDWEHLKRVHKSYIDSIVVEICLPGSPIPKGVLLHILRDAVDETPKDAKLFSQLLWDAMGDLSIAVSLLDLLESPLLDEEGQAWKKDSPKMPDDYEAWVDAQLFSENACKEYATFKDQLSPWAIVIGQQTVDTIWKYINLNYQGVCGKTIDELWQLSDIKKRAPAWFAKPPPKEGEEKKPDYDSDDNTKPKTVAKSTGAKASASKTNKNAKRIGDGNDSDGSMPSLQTVSDSSEDDFNFESDSEDDESEEEDSDDESEFDEEMEDHVRELIRDAMDIAMVDPDFTNPRRQAQLFEDMANDKKDNNPFIKLLGSLRGRLFSGSGAMKTANRAQPRSPYSGPKPPASAYKPAPPPPPPKAKAKPKPTPSKKAAPQPKSQSATVEDASDDEEPTAAKKKKKKKPKKKKKSAGGGAEAQEAEAEPEPEPEPEPELEPAPPTVSSPPTSPQKNKKNKAASVKSTASSATVAPSTGSTITLPLPTEQTAQSARSYLRDVGLDSEKTKLKTRADHGNLATITERKGFFSRFTREKSEKSHVDEDAKHGMFEQLTKKAKTYMHQILNTPEDEKRGLAPMKWEHFCRVMTEMGFLVNESTAGSSVRFEPTNGRDHPITFHKPHPDPTIQPVMLKQFGKRLKRQYGWSEDDFYRRMS